MSQTYKSAVLEPIPVGNTVSKIILPGINYIPIRDLFIMTGKRPLTCKRIAKIQSHPAGVNRGAEPWGCYVDHCTNTTFSTREELNCFLTTVIHFH